MKTAEEIIAEQVHEVASIPPDTTIRNALIEMTSRNIGAILIKNGDDYVGIWTERDLMRNILKVGFDPETARIKDYMTTHLQFAEHSDTVWQLQDKILGLRIRHLLIKKGDTFIGMVSSGDVAKHGLNEKTEELKKLNKMVSWEYYENWRW